MALSLNILILSASWWALSLKNLLCHLPHSTKSQHIILVTLMLKLALVSVKEIGVLQVSLTTTENVHFEGFYSSLPLF